MLSHFDMVQKQLLHYTLRKSSSDEIQKHAAMAFATYASGCQRHLSLAVLVYDQLWVTQARHQVDRLLFSYTNVEHLAGQQKAKACMPRQGIELQLTRASLMWWPNIYHNYSGEDNSRY